jgi:hypothetical protein
MTRAWLLAAGLLVVAGCGPDAPDAGADAGETVRLVPTSTGTAALPSSTAGALDPGRMAQTVCDALRTLDNEIIAVANRSSAGIDEVAADRRMARIDDAITEVEGIVEAWGRRITELDLPAELHGDVVRDQLVAGVPAALAELADQQAKFAAGDQVVPDDEVRGVFGVWFNSIEKVLSVLEPEIFRLDDPAVEQAFLDEPSCRNVVQLYVVD